MKRVLSTVKKAPPHVVTLEEAVTNMGKLGDLCVITAAPLGTVWPSARHCPTLGVPPFHVRDERTHDFKRLQNLPNFFPSIPRWKHNLGICACWCPGGVCIGVRVADVLAVSASGSVLADVISNAPLGGTRGQGAEAASVLLPYLSVFVNCSLSRMRVWSLSDLFPAGSPGPSTGLSL